MDESIQKELEKKANDEAEKLTRREPEHWVWRYHWNEDCRLCHDRYPQKRTTCIEHHTDQRGMEGSDGKPVRIDKTL